MSVRPPRTAEVRRSSEPEGLRARKKRRQRGQLSDTATRLFLERGFDGVRVAEIAEACGVSVATVFNYFTTKESLILDRLDTTASAIVQALGDPSNEPVAAVVGVLNEQLSQLFVASSAGRSDETATLESMHRFGALLRSTPSLRAHFSDRNATYTTSAAAALAERYRLDPDDPRMMIAATALVGLWQVQSDSLFRATGTATGLAATIGRVEADLEVAGNLVSQGLDTLRYPASAK